MAVTTTAATSVGLLDPAALSLVVVGTALATAARCGWRESAAALRAAALLLRRGFDAEANRKALAHALAAIAREGARRADPALPPDPALAQLVETSLREATPAALATARRAARSEAQAGMAGSAQVFALAGELAPVWGLIGTLYGLAQLGAPSGGGATATIMAAMASAVHTTLYGALLAHLVCHPLAAAITRRARAEQRARAALADWFLGQLARRTPATPPARAHLRGVA